MIRKTENCHLELGHDGQNYFIKITGNLMTPSNLHEAPNRLDQINKLVQCDISYQKILLKIMMMIITGNL